MVIPAMALLQQHDTCRDIVTEPAAQRRAAIEARGTPNCGHLELGSSELGAQSGCKNPPACLSVCYNRDNVHCTGPAAKHYFSRCYFLGSPSWLL